eukprot:GCRY01003578.1.p1 GENE.GCRY01003578.1~~GCRY01003578.1.p1  ORF type:complete len:524 (+),score=59.45 GCRY01003578.1:34-1605(+)
MSEEYPLSGPEAILVECQYCGRTFTESALEVHEWCCEKVGPIRLVPHKSAESVVPLQSWKRSENIQREQTPKMQHSLSTPTTKLDFSVHRHSHTHRKNQQHSSLIDLHDKNGKKSSSSSKQLVAGTVPKEASHRGKETQSPKRSSPEAMIYQNVSKDAHLMHSLRACSYCNTPIPKQLFRVHEAQCRRTHRKIEVTPAAQHSAGPHSPHHHAAATSQHSPTRLRFASPIERSSADSAIRDSPLRHSLNDFPQMRDSQEGGARLRRANGLAQSFPNSRISRLPTIPPSPSALTTSSKDSKETHSPASSGSSPPISEETSGPTNEISPISQNDSVTNTHVDSADTEVKEEETTVAENSPAPNRLNCSDEDHALPVPRSPSASSSYSSTSSSSFPSLDLPLSSSTTTSPSRTGGWVPHHVRTPPGYVRPDKRETWTTANSVVCPYCKRRMSTRAGERHIEACQHIRHRPKDIHPGQLRGHLYSNRPKKTPSPPYGENRDLAQHVISSIESHRQKQFTPGEKLIFRL